MNHWIKKLKTKSVILVFHDALVEKSITKLRLFSTAAFPSIYYFYSLKFIIEVYIRLFFLCYMNIRDRKCWGSLKKLKFKI